MRKIEDRKFLDDRILLDDANWVGCTFDGCILVLNKTRPSIIERCRVLDCRLEGDGWPEEILRLNGQV